MLKMLRLAVTANLAMLPRRLELFRDREDGRICDSGSQRGEKGYPVRPQQFLLLFLAENLRVC